MLNFNMNDVMGKNTDLTEVLLKVIAINKLYCTTVFDTFTLAKHTHGRNIDKLLEEKDFKFIDTINTATFNAKSEVSIRFFQNTAHNINLKVFPFLTLPLNLYCDT